MDDPDRCYASALRILRHRFNSTAELKRKLRTKGFTKEDIDPTIQRLAAEKWLDDERFAGAFVRTRARKRIGRLRIRRELMGAGVEDEIIARAVGENVDSDDERQTAIRTAQRRLPILIRRYGEQAARNKLAAYLLKQGYEAALVRDIVKEITVAQD
ncbi:MAG TPA: regulatory protein RecX [Thermoanaerobaculia bacterium]